MTRKRKTRPCNRCVGAEITWLNADDFEFCPEHFGEVMREIKAGARRKRFTVVGSDSLQ